MFEEPLSRGRPVPGFEATLEEVEGLTVFHVGFERPEGGLRYGVALDGHSVLAGFSRIPADRPIGEVVAEARDRAHAIGDEILVVLWSFGLGDGHAGRAGGDVAILMAEGMEAAYPDLGTEGRRALVAEMQARLMRAGLREAFRMIGGERLRVYDALSAQPGHALTIDARVLVMPAGTAAGIVAAMDAHPALGDLLSSQWRAVEIGASTVETAAAMLSRHRFDAAGARALIARLPGEGTVLDVYSAHLLSAVPRDWIPLPEAAGEWSALCRLGHVVVGASRAAGTPVTELCAHAKGRWAAFAATLARAAGVGLDVGPVGLHAGDGYVSLDRAADDVRDYREDLVTGLARPLVSWRRRREVAGDDPEVKELALGLLFRGRGLARILSDARRWHARGVRGPGASVGTGSWPDVLPRWSDGTVAVEPLSSRAELAAEGADGVDARGIAGLSHCVASRWEACRTGRARIVGLRRASDGARLSTLQVAFDAGMAPSLQEHRGARNAAPPPEAERAAVAYVAGLASGSIPFDGAGLAAGRRMRAGALEDRCGYDWRDPAMLREAITAWSPYLERRLRPLGPGEILDAMGLPDRGTRG